jgi:hypothetical protein
MTVLRTILVKPHGNGILNLTHQSHLRTGPQAVSHLQHVAIIVARCAGWVDVP